MPKKKFSSSGSGSGSGSSSSNHKRQKKNSICSHCSSDKDYLDFNCKKYFDTNSELKYSGPITSIDINTYLNLRIEQFSTLDNIVLNLNQEDCIYINDGIIKINESLIQSKNITISKYIANGCYGVIFVSSVEDGNIYVIKFIKNNPNNENEIKTMINIKEINNTHIPNFINIAYYHLNCNRITHQDTDNKILTGIKNCLKTDKYSMIVLEYFDGTIFDLINSNFPLFPPNKRNFTPEKIELFNSIFAQLIITIFLFHNKFEYYHNDTHLKNFLYKKVDNNNKYFHYKIGDNNYYIKNCGYVIVLSDYGLSKKINVHYTNKYKKNKLKDYEDVFDNIFLCRNKIILTGTNKLDKYKDISCNKNFDDFDEFEFFNNMMTSILKINTVKTHDMILINEIPYEL